jgi:hypothetical protein
MDARYNVYFAGQIQPGQDLASVRDKLAKLFNADQQTLDKLFSGKAQLLKRDCDQATAQKYKQAMERAGAQPIVKASETTAAVEKPPAPAAPSKLSAAERIAALAAAPDEASYRTTEAAPPAAEQPTDSVQEGIDLAPPGTEVLRANERAEAVAIEVDTSGLEIDAPVQRLSEESPSPPAAPDTSHLDMGEVGETIPNLSSNQEPLSPNTDAIGLSPQGTDFTDCTPPPPDAPTLDLSEIKLAPAGAEVMEEKYRKKEQAEAPTTDHISLED